MCYTWYSWSTVASFTPRKVIWGHLMTSSGHFTFLPITFDRKEIETWGRCQGVCLTKRDQMIYNMTYLCHLLTLTLRDPRSYLQSDLLRSKSISFDRAWREEHIGVKIIPLTYVVQKLLIKNFFPKSVNLIFDDLWCTHYWSVRQSEGTGW